MKHVEFTPEQMAIVEPIVEDLHRQLAEANAALAETGNMLEIAQGAASSWQATAIATEQREEAQKARRRTADAALAEAVTILEGFTKMGGPTQQRHGPMDRLRQDARAFLARRAALQESR